MVNSLESTLETFVYISQTIQEINITEKLTDPIKKLSSTVETFQKKSVVFYELQQSMHKCMDATQGEIQSIHSLISVQEELSVVSQKTQMAGASELENIVEKKECMEELLSVMDSVIINQYGFQAAQIDAVNTSETFKNSLIENTDSFKEFGDTVSEAQEKVSGLGAEEEQVKSSMDGVNESAEEINETLRETPLDKIRELAENISKLREHIKASASDIYTSIQNIVGRISTVIGVDCMPILEGVVGTIGDWWNKLLEGSPIIDAITIAIQGFAIAMEILTLKTKLMAAWAGIVTHAKAIWAGVQSVLNMILMASPLTWIIAGIIALIAVIGYVAYKTDGWGKQWDSIVNFMKYTFLAYTESIKFAFNTVVDGFMIGIDKIRLGWYKFKDAVGIGKDSENAEMIAQISQDVENRQNAIVEGAKKVEEYTQKAKDSLSWELSWNKERSLGDFATGLKEQLGLGQMEQLQENTAGAPDSTLQNQSSVFSGNGNEGSGSRTSNTINIHIGSLVENIIFQGSVRDNQDMLERDLAEAMYNVLNIAQNSVN